MILLYQSQIPNRKPKLNRLKESYILIPQSIRLSLVSTRRICMSLDFMGNHHSDLNVKTMVQDVHISKKYGGGIVYDE